FESAHDLFIEPAVQETMRHTHNVLGFLLTWPDIIQFANSMYAFGHIFITLAVAAWLYVDHRAGFRMVRNVMLITNAAAFALYELYPLAPPRLTSGLRYDGRAFHFQDTMGHVLGTGTLNGTPIAYNPFSAMPSIHVAWALIIGISLVILARHAVLKALGALYPLIMTFAVLVTANHYVLDAIGAAAVVLLAGAIVFGTEQIRSRLRQRTGSLHEPPAISPPILKSA
ncbi:MAG TPA: phosphatase PAP2 family protein, partial [Chloroflexota bacterium]